MPRMTVVSSSANADAGASSTSRLTRTASFLGLLVSCSALRFHRKLNGVPIRQLRRTSHSLGGSTFGSRRGNQSQLAVAVMSQLWRPLNRKCRYLAVQQKVKAWRQADPETAG